MPLVHPAITTGGNENHGQPLQLDASGNLLVNIAQGSISASSGAQYNATPPTFTNGTTNPLQMDLNGNLKVAGTINASSSATAQSSPQTFTGGSSNALQADTHGALMISQRDTSGAAMGVLANPLRTDPTGTTTQPVSVASQVSVAEVSPTLNVGQVSAGASATLILGANANRKRLLVTNLGTTDVYLGGSGVTAGSGHLLKGIAGYPVSLRFTGAVYGITASGTQAVTYAEETN